MLGWKKSHRFGKNQSTGQRVKINAAHVDSFWGYLLTRLSGLVLERSAIPAGYRCLLFPPSCQDSFMQTFEMLLKLARFKQLSISCIKINPFSWSFPPIKEGSVPMEQFEFGPMLFLAQKKSHWQQPSVVFTSILEVHIVPVLFLIELDSLDLLYMNSWWCFNVVDVWIF